MPNAAPFFPETASLQSTSGAGAVTLIDTPSDNDARLLILDNSATGTGDALVSIDGGSTYPILVRAGKSVTLPLPYCPTKAIMMKRQGSIDVASMWGSLMRHERPS